MQANLSLAYPNKFVKSSSSLTPAYPCMHISMHAEGGVLTIFLLVWSVSAYVLHIMYVFTYYVCVIHTRTRAHTKQTQIGRDRKAKWHKCSIFFKFFASWCMHTHARIHTCTIYKHTCSILDCFRYHIHACVHADIHAYIHTYIHTYIHSSQCFRRIFSRFSGLYACVASYSLLATMANGKGKYVCMCTHINVE
jgi:hypothetical protein